MRSKKLLHRQTENANERLPLTPTSTPTRRGAAQIMSESWHTIFDQFGQHNMRENI